MHIPPHKLVSDYGVLSVDLGLRAYGLETGRARTPQRYGVFAAPTACFWGFDKPAARVSGPETGQVFWEIEGFLKLAMAGDPTVLECLWSEVVDYCDDIGDGLITLRPHLISKRAYGAYLREANSRIDRLSGAGTEDWVAVMHMLRLLISLTHLLRTGEPLLRMDAYRDRLLSVGRGEADWSQVRDWRDRLSADAESARSTTGLPTDPDRQAADRFLIEVRRRMV